MIRSQKLAAAIKKLDEDAQMLGDSEDVYEGTGKRFVSRTARRQHFMHCFVGEQGQVNPFSVEAPKASVPVEVELAAGTDDTDVRNQYGLTEALKNRLQAARVTI